MTELYFNDLPVRVGVATVAIESVTATVIDLYVYWKPGFMLKLEAWLATSLSVGRDGSGLGSSIGFKDLTTWQRQQIGNLELLDSTLVVLGINDSMTR